MGRAAGTGSPIAFECPKYRKLDWRTRSSRDREYHAVERTGRTRHKPPAHGLGTRNMFTAFEYRCRCGYTGWTTHQDVTRRPIVEVGADLSWRLVADVRPYGKVELRDAHGVVEVQSFLYRHQKPDDRWVEWRPSADGGRIAGGAR